MGMGVSPIVTIKSLMTKGVLCVSEANCLNEVNLIVVRLLMGVLWVTPPKMSLRWKLRGKGQINPTKKTHLIHE